MSVEPAVPATVAAPARSRWSRLMMRLGLRKRRTEPVTASAPGPDLPPGSDLPEELAKLQRGLRRLSLAHDRQGELLQGIAQRMQDLDQNVMQLALRRSREVALDEDKLLRFLDGLDRCRALPDLPEAAGESLRALYESLCSAAGWRALATLGATPASIHLRIAEVLPLPGATSFRIWHILEQGYTRADGSAVRPAVVVAAGPGQGPIEAPLVAESAHPDPPSGPSPGPSSGGPAL